MRETLKNIYEVFIKKWGRLNSQKVKRVLKAHPSYFVISASLEVKEGDKEWRTSDSLLYGPVEEVEYKTTSVTDALSYVMGMTGSVDIDAIANICDLDSEEVLHELGDLVYLNPDTMSYESADKYLSGNVVQKLQRAKEVLKDLQKGQVEEEKVEPAEEITYWQSSGAKLGYQHPRPWRKGR